MIIMSALVRIVGEKVRLCSNAAVRVGSISKVQGLGYRVQGTEYWVQGAGYRVMGLGYSSRVQGTG